MSKHLLRSYHLPEHLTRTPSSLLSEAGRRPGNRAELARLALGHFPLDEETEAYLLPKLKPYTPGPGFDNMFFVAREGGLVGGIEDLEVSQVTKLLRMSERVFSVYEKNTDLYDPLVREVIAINYHRDPIRDETLSRRLFAQTLKDLHLHLVGFRESDLHELPVVNRNALSKKQYLVVDEPLGFVMERIVAVPSIQRRLQAGLELLTKKQKATFSGIEFTCHTTEFADLSQDLLQLHQNILDLYQEITDLFVYPEQRDGFGMPLLRDSLEREQRIRDFFALEALNDPAVGRLARAFLRISRQLREADGSQIPIFLRGPAYTLALIREPATSEITVNIALRLLSNGNVLATFGYHQVANQIPSADWMETKARNERALSSAI